MESISYGTDGSKILELHETGRTHLLNLPSIWILLLIKKLSKAECEIASLFRILQWHENFKYRSEAKDSQSWKMLPMSSAHYEYLIRGNMPTFITMQPSSMQTAEKVILPSTFTTNSGQGQKPKPPGQLPRRAHLLDGKRGTFFHVETYNFNT